MIGPASLTEFLDALLASLDLSAPSYFYLAIAALTAYGGAYEINRLRNDTGARLFPEIPRLNAVLLWAECLYILLRWPVTAFAALPLWLGQGLLAFIMYSLLFAPLWVGLAIFAIKFTRSLATGNIPVGRRRKLRIAFMAISVWGLLGEIRMLLDPELIERLGRT